jgi:prepilin-type processing-associated H-X9-DG protein
MCDVAVESLGAMGSVAAYHLTRRETIQRTLTPEDSTRIRAFLTERIPEFVGPVVCGHICIYTNSPDAHFIVDRHSGHAAVAFADGISGHRFNFSTVVGEILTALTMDRPPATESNLARLERLTADQLPG